MSAIRRMSVHAGDPKAEQRMRTMIRVLYAEHARSRDMTPLDQVRKHRRFCELELVFAYYWRGLELPDDDAGRDCLYIAACHLWYIGRRYGPVVAVRIWASMWAPWCGADELTALIERIEADPRKWTADELAEELGPGLSMAVRQALRVTTIGAYDLDKAGREKRRKNRNAQEETKRRRNRGAVSRAQYLAANSKSREKPWEALGVSRRTYERRMRKARETETVAGPCTAKEGDILVSTDLRQTESQPWRAISTSRATYYRKRKAGNQSLSGAIAIWALEGAAKPKRSGAHHQYRGERQ